MIYKIYCPICEEEYIISKEKYFPDFTSDNNTEKFNINGKICNHMINLFYMFKES